MCNTLVKIYSFNGPMPVWWDIKTHRMISVKKLRKILPLFFKLLLINGPFTLIPGLIKLIYFLYFCIENGQLKRDSEEFCAPLDFLTIAIVLMTNGAAFVIWFIAYFFQDGLSNICRLQIDTYELLNKSKGN